MPLITSKANAQIKAVRALKNRRERDRTGLFVAEGIQVVREALRTSAEIEMLIVAPDRLGKAESEVAGRITGASVLEVTGEVFDSVSYREDPQSIAVVVRQCWEQLPAQPEGERLWVALQDIQHPGNLGTIIRTSDAAGGAGVIISGQSTDPYHPVAVRGSLGAVFSQRLVRASAAEFAAWVKGYAATVIGTSPAGEVDYRDADYKTPVVLISGNERIGLSKEQIALCDQVVSIPMAGAVDSLNLSIATALVLYEVARQDRSAP